SLFVIVLPVPLCPLSLGPGHVCSGVLAFLHVSCHLIVRLYFLLSLCQHICTIAFDRADDFVVVHLLQLAHIWQWLTRMLLLPLLCPPFILCYLRSDGLSRFCF